MLYDVGADTLTGRETRVFEVVDGGTEEVRVVKDCWIEDNPEEQLEHEIVARIKQDTNDDENFREHFTDVCGYRKTDISGGFDNVCKMTEDRTFEGTKFVREFPVPAFTRDQPIPARLRTQSRIKTTTFS